MKTILAALLFLLYSLPLWAQARLEYNGKPINTVQIQKLYDYSKDFLFTYKGKVYDIRGEDGEINTLSRDAEIGDVGMVKGRIISRFSKTAAIAELVFEQWISTGSGSFSGQVDHGGFTKKFIRTCTLLGFDLESGEDVDMPVLRVDKLKVGAPDIGEDMTLAVLKPLSKPEFAKYIKINYIYEYKMDYELCPECKGKGYIAHEPERGKMQGLKEKCPYCNGTKKVKSQLSKVPVEL